MKIHSEKLAARLVESEKYQRGLADRVQKEDDPTFERKNVIGIDVSYRDEKAFGCAVVYNISTHTITQTEMLVTDCEYPYIPGHFYLREGPIIIKLLNEIQDTGPILIDGNGVLHPRRMGLASYIGVKMNRQTIGVAKSLLLGTVDSRVKNLATIVDDGEEIGAALWIGKKKNPIYVSIGHKISLHTAIEVVTVVSNTDYPEPLRQAHLCSKSMQK